MNLIFDLDNTIYSSERGVLEAINQNINRFMVEYAGIERSEVDLLRQKYRQEYGVTLRGLILHYGISPEDYLEFVHNIDYSRLISKDESLFNILNKLPNKKFVFTNSSRKHAENILSHLGIKEFFSKIISIEDTKYTPKPKPLSFKIMLEQLDVEPEKSFFFDDMPENIETAKKLKFKTVLIGKSEHFPKADYTIKDIYEIQNIEEIIQ
ncbi:MAG: pyrimidine 5'-nucleotidase [Calditerrivibrio sp.]|nr:pyrimidine 5'-nucleotidase [Calditerrivibrio sp.]MCA1933076.1 pyrimidine 5'-nucleotidase [Calditerrivibrio sp.]MCA1980252.1 pyrimidine 5'-nucleotidase [Calditerrivibrio sp.]